MNELQKEAFQLMENQIKVVGFTPVQALTMVMSYYKGGYYKNMSEDEIQVVVKRFVEKYM
ncbi:hypothetical protein P7D31_12095 [Enterococcus dongliensis]|uniref:hypothetical protein n=1 Tax=Enterococcus dongliensis TaxID=2559925 RepID=UPI00288EB9F8|nr:hypothetical protein [Enterococcus dongliensis]MDT2640850.1 hypothetical protein [Enterococcus dongliensis]